MKTIVLASLVAVAIGISILWVQSIEPNSYRNILTDKLLWNNKNVDNKVINDGKRFLDTKTDIDIIDQKKYEKIGEKKTEKKDQKKDQKQVVDHEFIYERLKPLLSKFPDWKNTKLKDFDYKDCSA